jgi:hypothetical protein
MLSFKLQEATGPIRRARGQPARAGPRWPPGAGPAAVTVTVITDDHDPSHDPSHDHDRYESRVVLPRPSQDSESAAPAPGAGTPSHRDDQTREFTLARSQSWVI